MKKTLAITVVLMFVAVSGAFALGTEDNWSIKLTFSTTSSSDLLPVEVGVGAAASEMLKPPPLPGMAETGNSEDAVVNAIVRSTQRDAAISILDADSQTASAIMWELQVSTEESGQVSVTPDLSNMSSNGKMKYFLIDADTGAKTELTTSGTPIAIFTSSGAPKTLFAMAGTTEAYAIAKSDGTILGAAKIGVDDVTDHSGVGVYLDGSNSSSAVTATDGTYTVTGLSQSDHTVKLDGTCMLPSTVTVTVPSSGYSSAPITDLRKCDFDDLNDKCYFNDFKVLKLAYKSSAGDDNFNACADANGDGQVNFTDFKVLKLNYNQVAD